LKENSIFDKTHIIVDSMDIPKKFELNTEEFKIYFDNDKKTHVCENIETGEKTNIGFFGILLQMGIIKTVDEKIGNTINSISEKLESLEAKIEDLTKRIDEISIEPVSSHKESEKIHKEVEKKPTSDIKERIMKNVLEKSEEPDEEESDEEELEEEPESDVVVESDEEIDNWENI